MAIWWLLGAGLIVAYPLVKFKLFHPTRLPQPEKESVRISPIHTSKERTPEELLEKLKMVEREIEEASQETSNKKED